MSDNYNETFDGIYKALDLINQKLNELDKRVQKLEWKPPTERQLELLFKLCQERDVEYPKDAKRKSRKEISKIINDLLGMEVKKK